MPLIVPDPPATVSFATAEQRRRSLQQHLATRVESARQVMAFRELPGRDSGERLSYLEGAEASAEIARLQWQVRSSGRLLLERVSDVLESQINRGETIPPGSIDISLQPNPQYPSNPALAPWRVVISAPNKLRLDQTLPPFSNFFGVGIFLKGESKFKPFSRCKAGNGGLEGVVGGILRSNLKPEEVYLSTCSHVVAFGCGSKYHAPGSDSRVYEVDDSLHSSAPDAELLRPTECFKHPEMNSEPVFPADEDSISRFQIARSPLILHHPDRRCTLGWLKYPVSAFLGPYNRLIRFPHYSIQPFRYHIGFLRWPLFQPNFAVPGDSGGWVIEKRTRIWLGMVVGGYDDHSETLVADGQALLDYYSGIISGRAPRKGQTEFIPCTWA